MRIFTNSEKGVRVQLLLLLLLPLSSSPLLLLVAPLGATELLPLPVLRVRRHLQKWRRHGHLAVLFYDKQFLGTYKTDPYFL